MITQEMNKPFFEQVWARPRTIAPDSLSKSPMPAMFETVDDKKVLSDETRTLEIYRLNHWMAGWELMRLVLMLVALGIAARTMLSPTMCIIAITIILTTCNLTLLGLNTLAIWRVTVRAESPAR